MPGATNCSDRRTVFLNFFKIFGFVSFFVKICPDDDCRTSVEKSAFLLISIFLIGDNDLA